jgi:outer membrane phospholipase A
MKCASYTYAILIGILLACSAHAEDELQRCETHVAEPMKLGEISKIVCIYEPNTIGWTKDSDDVAFMDFKLSVRAQLIPARSSKWFGTNSALYFSYTGRLAQYIGTRDSSPVVGKQFNPQFFYRYWTEPCHGGKDCPDTYIDFVLYGHESNGQSINNAAELSAAQTAEAGKPNGRSAFAYDQISRGWDYLAVKWKKDKLIHEGSTIENGEKSRFDMNLTTYVGLKYFLAHGLLQGAPEQYDPTWESDPEGKSRNSVDGISLMAKGIGYFKHDEVIKYVVKLTTGYVQPLRYNTVRVELGFRSFDSLPLTFWYQYGYNSDLAQYYKKGTSRGINIELGSF